MFLNNLKVKVRIVFFNAISYVLNTDITSPIHSSHNQNLSLMTYISSKKSQDFVIISAPLTYLFRVFYDQLLCYLTHPFPHVTLFMRTFSEDIFSFSPKERGSSFSSCYIFCRQAFTQLHQSVISLSVLRSPAFFLRTSVSRN